MWGIRAIRVWFLLGGLTATIAASGCCECCKNLWKSEKPPATTGGFESKQIGATNGDAAKPNQTAEGWQDWRWGGPIPKDTKLTPERVHGGIY
jgi:hypothetical protein